MLRFKDLQVGDIFRCLGQFRGCVFEKTGDGDVESVDPEVACNARLVSGQYGNVGVGQLAFTFVDEPVEKVEPNAV